MEGQDILSFIGSKPRPNEEDVAFVIRPLLEVVNYLHGQQIVHLDIRVSGILGSSCASIIYNWLIHWLTFWLADCLTDSLTVLLIKFLWMTYLSAWLFDCLLHWWFFYLYLFIHLFVCFLAQQHFHRQEQFGCKTYRLRKCSSHQELEGRRHAGYCKLSCVHRYGVVLVSRLYRSRYFGHVQNYF